MRAGTDLEFREYRHQLRFHRCDAFSQSVCDVAVSKPFGDELGDPSFGYCKHCHLLSATPNQTVFESVLEEHTKHRHSPVTNASLQSHDRAQVRVSRMPHEQTSSEFWTRVDTPGVSPALPQAVAGGNNFSWYLRVNPFEDRQVHWPDGVPAGQKLQPFAVGKENAATGVECHGSRREGIAERLEGQVFQSSIVTTFFAENAGGKSVAAHL